MDSCEQQVITACGLDLLSEEGKLVKRKTGFIMFFGQKKRKENFKLRLDSER